MLRTPWIILALAGLFLAPFSLSLQAQQEGRDIEEEQENPEGRASLRVSVNQINVDVTVQDRDGNLIGGLSKQHFKIYENKIEQEVTYFAPVEAPMTAILVTEYSSVIPWEWLYD